MGIRRKCIVSGTVQGNLLDVVPELLLMRPQLDLTEAKKRNGKRKLRKLQAPDFKSDNQNINKINDNKPGYKNAGFTF